MEVTAAAVNNMAQGEAGAEGIGSDTAQEAQTGLEEAEEEAAAGTTPRLVIEVGPAHPATR